VHIITGRRDNVSEMRPFIYKLYNIATNTEDRSCGMTCRPTVDFFIQRMDNNENKT